MVPTGAVAGVVRGRMVGLDQVRFSAFASNIGTPFWVPLDPVAAIALELVEATPTARANLAATSAPDAGNEKFSLVFRGLPSQALEQDTYLFEHGRIGRFEMFIVPVGASADGYVYYEAVFNRPPTRLGTR